MSTIKTPEERVQIIIDLIKPYYDDPTTRAITSDDRCRYLTPDGKMCAFGKCMDMSLYDVNMEGKGANSLLEYYPEDILKPEYRGLFTPYQWRIIQGLHDFPKEIKSHIAMLNTEGFPIKITDIIPT